ncbi:hypothetical protein K466DRAFT_403255 [Polyporus arcularius HHB13444]|uniref:Uncharacterized protein n=1 Tax=Polyporus arcularius HHB13444 TaxID=1314778 RepID=A0A5C3NRC3_9APHY|nr:hypothetical protein K466DRAFT_403255 [Polyporus arcularius HHB13444]
MMFVSVVVVVSCLAIYFQLNMLILVPTLTILQNLWRYRQVPRNSTKRLTSGRTEALCQVCPLPLRSASTSSVLPGRRLQVTLQPPGTNAAHTRERAEFDVGRAFRSGLERHVVLRHPLHLSWPTSSILGTALSSGI